MFLDETTFKTVIASTPLISIDLVVKNTKDEYLLGFRNNRPAQGFWFVPGGRVLKDETMDDAFIRLCQDELGISLTRQKASFLGPFEHFYNDYVFGEDITTHYVVLGYALTIDIDLASLPQEQHNQYAWFTANDLLRRENVHTHSKWYVAADGPLNTGNSE
ncbi:MAG: colanic acid biosynthesis protein WcaH [Paraglaciecola sp.]|jgi:colanic acid biosynthesis protein WcaH